MVKAKKKQQTQLQTAHQKFLKKMGVTKAQLKQRKLERQDPSSKFNPDTIDTVRKAYDL